MTRRQQFPLSVLLAFFILLAITYLFTGTTSVVARSPAPLPPPAELPLSKDKSMAAQSPAKAKTVFEVGKNSILDLSQVDSIAPKLENATLKAELGRATWRFLHTMVARFPEKPSEKERQVLESFWNNFAMLYPCGDCARHFREMLQEHPPQTSSRNAAAGWLCAMHNKVNKRLGKPEYDCTTLGDAYDCGCGDDPKKDKGGVSLKDNHGAKKQGKEIGEKTLGLAKARKLVRAVGVAFS